MRTKGLAFLVLSVLLLWAVPALGQVDSATATLKGTVKDQHEAVIAGATVTVTSVDRGVSKSATTGTDGTFQIPLLQPGAYRVQVEASGFNKAVADGIGLTVGQSLVYNVQLGAGGVTANVSVTSELPLIQVEQTQQANTINQSQVENLPNINRTMTAAVFTLPGVSSSDAARSQQPGYTGFGTTGFSIGGSNGRNNLSTIDGGENEYGTGAYRVLIPVDAIREYQVNRNSFAAEFGFTVGSSVNIVTKSGTNKFHGTAYGYYRDDRTSANNFIDQLRGSPHLLRGKTTTELYSQHAITGGTVGGPIKKDKLFFFTSYEFVKDDLGAFNFLLNSPNALGINGNSSLGIAQTAYFDGLAGSGNARLVGFGAALRPRFVPQNGAANTNNANFVTLLSRDDGAYNNATRVHTLLSRIDYQPNANNSWNFRFELSHGLNGKQSFSSGAGLVTRDYSILTNWAHTFGGSVVNQLRVQIVPFSRADNVPNAEKGSIADPAVAATAPPAITISGFGIGGFVPDFTFGANPAIPYLAHQRRYQFEDTVAWVKGHHNFKVGASYRPVSYNVEDDLYFNGQFSFTDSTFSILNLAGALTSATSQALQNFNVANGYGVFNPTQVTAANPLGFVATAKLLATNLSGAQSFVFNLPSSLHQGFNNPVWHGTAHYFGSFAQDSWRVSPKLTLDLGGRFDFDAEPPPLVHRSYFSPRLGFAWTPSGDQKTVIRGGAGVFEGPIDVLIPSYTSILDDTGRYINQILPTAAACGTGCPTSTTLYGLAVAAGLLPFGHVPASFYNANGQATGPGALNRVVFNADPNYKNPYSIQASLSVQRQIANNLSLEVGYLMYHGLHLQMPVESNFKETGVVDPFLGPLYTAVDKPACLTTTPLPTCALSIVSYRSIGKSIYHGMTVSLNKRYSNGLQFGANYTFSKTIDDVLDFSSSQAFFRPTRLNLYRGISAYDFPHVFSVNAVYASPFKAGPGHNVISRMLADFTVAPVLTLRSGIPFSIRLPAISGTGIATTDRNFATPFAASRNSSRGDPYKTLDLLIRKSLYLKRDRGLRFDISLEGTNILNRRNFNKVWDQFDTLGASAANPVVTFANGTTANLLTGPYNFKGFVPTSASQLQNVPLAFVGTDGPRRVSVGLRFSF